MSILPRSLLHHTRPAARRRVPAALAAAVLAAAAVPAARLAAAQPAPGEAPCAPAPRPLTGDGGMPRPFGLALLATVASGMAGAAAAARIGGGRGQASRPAALLETLVVGSVCAVALLGVNPPGGAWPALAWTAAAGGLAGQALLAASAGARRVLAAELAQGAAEEGARRVAVLAGEQMETLRRLAVDGGGMIGSGTAPGDSRERTLDVYAERARLELLRVARREPAGRHRTAGTAGGEAEG